MKKPKSLRIGVFKRLQGEFRNKYNKLIRGNMARIRTIKPQHWGDKELSKISLQAHLLWIASWNFSDDQGVFEADPLYIKSQVFPRRTDIRVEQINLWLDQLTQARFIVPITYHGDSYYINRTFTTHQKIDRPNPSVIPSDVIRRTLDEHSTNDRRSIGLVEESIVEDSKERKGFAPPSQDEVKDYFFSNGFSETSAITAFRYYNEAGWKDGRGNQVKNWKQKMISVWFKPENKIQAQVTVNPKVSN